MKVFMNNDREDRIDPTRRGMLKKLGLVTVVAYAAPVMLKLSEAHASSSISNSNSSSNS